jgi:hypothetical protein
LDSPSSRVPRSRRPAGSSPSTPTPRRRKSPSRYESFPLSPLPISQCMRVDRVTRQADGSPTIFPVFQFGATEFVNPKDLPEGKTITEHLVEITDGGLDFTFDATGNVRSSRSLLPPLHPSPSLEPPANPAVDRSGVYRSRSCGPPLRLATRVGVFPPSSVRSFLSLLSPLYFSPRAYEMGLS